MLYIKYEGIVLLGRKGEFFLCLVSYGTRSTFKMYFPFIAFSTDKIIALLMFVTVQHFLFLFSVYLLKHFEIHSFNHWRRMNAMEQLSVC